MQDRYVGDIGDYAKYALLRALSPGFRLGVAWYLFPDEGHNADGKHTAYLESPGRWRSDDPWLFDVLKRLVKDGHRSTKAVEKAGVVPGAVYSSVLLSTDAIGVEKRADWRRDWFSNVLEELRHCDVVFADPDNGLCEDEQFRPGRLKDWKRLPLREAYALSDRRTAILYHHNTRRPGGHMEEIRHWINRMGLPCIALRWRPYSPRTFFIVNPGAVIEARAREWSARSHGRLELISA